MPSLKMKTLLLILISGWLTGCASDSKERLLPQRGPTMKEVYNNHFTGGDSLYIEDPLNEDADDEDEDDEEDEARLPPVIIFGRRPIHDADIDLAGYTREVDTEINSHFTRLPNPTLVMYIYPHLSVRGRHPVPGYSTHFTLYKTVEYALPGENEQDD